LAWHVRRNDISPPNHGRARLEYERLKQSANRLCQDLENEGLLRERAVRTWLEVIEWMMRDLTNKDKPIHKH